MNLTYSGFSKFVCVHVTITIKLSYEQKFPSKTSFPRLIHGMIKLHLNHRRIFWILITPDWSDHSSVQKSDDDLGLPGSKNSIYVLLCTTLNKTCTNLKNINYYALNYFNCRKTLIWDSKKKTCPYKGMPRQQSYF